MTARFTVNCRFIHPMRVPALEDTLLWKALTEDQRFTLIEFHYDSPEFEDALHEWQDSQGVCTGSDYTDPFEQHIENIHDLAFAE